MESTDNLTQIETQAIEINRLKGLLVNCRAAMHQTLQMLSTLAKAEIEDPLKYLLSIASTQLTTAMDLESDGYWVICTRSDDSMILDCKWSLPTAEGEYFVARMYQNTPRGQIEAACDAAVFNAQERTPRDFQLL